MLLLSDVLKWYEAFMILFFNLSKISNIIGDNCSNLYNYLENLRICSIYILFVVYIHILLLNS